MARAILAVDDVEIRFATAIRAAFDQAYDGRRTGRWDYSQLMKTEKTHLGTLVEIQVQREFGFTDGHVLDFRIAGSDVDCKWSRNLYEWEFPVEMFFDRDGNERPGVALVLWGNEHTQRWSAGLIRVSLEQLRGSPNRDQKRRLNDGGCDRILWLFRSAPMIPNALAHHPELAMQLMSLRSGQQAIVGLFRQLQGALVAQSTIETVARQIDNAKRVRDARQILAEEGIVIFGHYHPHPSMAETLGLPRPRLGTFVSARLTPASGDQPSVEIDGEQWQLAGPEAPVTRAPTLPNQGA